MRGSRQIAVRKVVVFQALLVVAVGATACGGASMTSGGGRAVHTECYDGGGPCAEQNNSVGGTASGICPADNPNCDRDATVPASAAGASVPK